jgi:pimeloyl-ACP methyl ester carboxylesterase
MSTTTRDVTIDLDAGALWAQESGDPDGSPVLLVMGAASSSAVWPPELLERLGRRHRVIVWDHRDTGRSTATYDAEPYALTDLAADAIRVLDACGIDRAHVVGMSMGGLLTQLLLLDHPDRLLSAALFCTGPLPGAPGAEALPGPSEDLLALWGSLGDERDAEAELAWRVEHWRLLHGHDTPFDAEAARALEERVVAHGGALDTGSATAHARAGVDGLARGAELGASRTPTVVVEAPADPAYPPPTARCLAEAIGPTGARLVTVPGMGHSLLPAVLDGFGDALAEHLDHADAQKTET